jgi:hypothetical protein
MKALKKIIMMILTVIACLSIILMCAERPDGSISLTWSLGWMAALVVSTKLLDRMGVFDGSR